MLMTGMDVGGVGFDRAVHVIAVVAFNFDLNRGVVDLEMMVKVVADGSQDLLSFTDALLGDQDMAGAGDDAGANCPDMEIVNVKNTRNFADGGNDGIHVQAVGSAFEEDGDALGQDTPGALEDQGSDDK